jgi:RNA 2',3'-cyclic 3'-phosphodiesterase
MRVFIALEIPADIQQELGDLQKLLRSVDARITWTAPVNIHLTLKFLGEISDKSLDDVIESCKHAVHRVSPFALALEGVGVFPNRRQPRVLWVGLKGEVTRLTGLASLLNDALAVKGFAPDSKPLRPHLTLGRIKSAERIDEVLSLGRNLRFQHQEFVIQEVLVVQSELGRTGSKYTVLARLPLTGLTSMHGEPPHHQ